MSRGSEALQAVWAAAVDDPAVSARLWADPEEVGRSFELRGADLAELVGAIRYGIAGKQRSREDFALTLDIARHRRGGEWPFRGLTTAELVERAAMAERRSAGLYVLKTHGHVSEDLDDVAAWALALLQELRARADQSDRVDPAVADSIVYARNLLVATEAVKGAGSAEP